MAIGSMGVNAGCERSERYPFGGFEGSTGLAHLAHPAYLA